MALLKQYSRSTQNLPPVTDLFGPLGPVQTATLHHSAGPLAPTKARCIALNQEYDREHRAKGWGGIGYHLCIDGLGRIYHLRPPGLKGAHVGLHNSNNFGIMLHGNYMVSEPNALQRRTLKRLYRGQVTGLKFLGQVPWKGHREWSGHESNACPGTNLFRYLNWLRSRPRNP